MRGAGILFLLLSLLVECTQGQNDYAEYARGESMVLHDLQPEVGALFCPLRYLIFLFHDHVM